MFCFVVSCPGAGWSRGSCGSQHPRAEHLCPAGLCGGVSGWVWSSPSMQGPAFVLTPWAFELSTIFVFPAGDPQDVCRVVGASVFHPPHSSMVFFPPPADAWGKMLSVPSDHRSAKLACPSPAFLYVPRAKDAPEARAHSPSLHSEPAVAIRQLLLFPKKPAKDHGLSGGERPGLRGRGNGSSGTEGRAPPASSPPLLLFPTFRDRTADAPAWSSPGIRPAGDGAQR